MSADQRQHRRTALRCAIKICHPSFGERIAQLRDLSDVGLYVVHPDLLTLRVGDRITGQVQNLPAVASVLLMEVTRVDAQGAGLRFVCD
jgi:hypothetical protein